MRSDRYVEENLKEQKMRREKCLALLEGLLEGKLSGGKVNGKIDYKKREQGKLQYLGYDSVDEVQGLKKRYFLEKMIKECEKNIAMMEHYIEDYCAIDSVSIMKKLQAAYYTDVMDEFEYDGYIDFRKWENSEVHAPDFKIGVVSGNCFRYLEQCGMIGEANYRTI